VPVAPTDVIGSFQVIARPGLERWNGNQFERRYGKTAHDPLDHCEATSDKRGKSVVHGTTRFEGGV
jgi:hypothetical protein